MSGTTTTVCLYVTLRDMRVCSVCVPVDRFLGVAIYGGYFFSLFFAFFFHLFLSFVLSIVFWEDFYPRVEQANVLLNSQPIRQSSHPSVHPTNRNDQACPSRREVSCGVLAEACISHTVDFLPLFRPDFLNAIYILNLYSVNAQDISMVALHRSTSDL